jgi:DNA-binding IclR family transcriptional regulator
MPPAEVRDLLRAPPYQVFTPHTLTSYEAVAQELYGVRNRGYAWDREEYLEAIRCVAAPLYSRHRRVIAIMSIAAPASRTPARRLHELTELLVEHAAAASARIVAEDPEGGPSSS